jgi:hypothetical protein
MNYFDICDIDGWCAGSKVSGLYTDINLSQVSLEKLIEQALDDGNPSCLVISANEDETGLLDWLKQNKFKRGPMIRNALHEHHKTWMFFKQITKAQLKKYGHSTYAQNGGGWY